ncbi:hypothetical protein ONE63_008208 [Megalurothrips usitatus]|uniref:Uncharacterized protein n=1 Tax=Megalurothrips usitatus TaxID=439358 RepID=A0AAV7XP16_9NEOP|nr:hypothetical protein ONE63_008208 [Megalurothrips usitatus]
MGRERKTRSRRYKSYYDKQGDGDVPESTLRYRKKCRLEPVDEVLYYSCLVKKVTSKPDPSAKYILFCLQLDVNEASSDDGDVSETGDTSDEDRQYEPGRDRGLSPEGGHRNEGGNCHSSDESNSSTSNESEELSGQDEDVSETGDTYDEDCQYEPERDRGLSPEGGHYESSQEISNQEHQELNHDYDQQQAGGDEDDANDGHTEDLRHAFKPFKHEMPSLTKKINLTVNTSVWEILINAVTLVHKHNWSHLEKEHLMKFIKSLIGNVAPRKVPASCIRPQQVKCIECKTANVLSDLSQATYFVVFHLPTQIETLLSDPQIRNKLYVL